MRSLSQAAMPSISASWLSKVLIVGAGPLKTEMVPLRVTETRSGTISVFNGPAPTINTFDSQDAEIEGIAAWLKERIGNGLQPEEIGVFVRSEAQIPRAKAALDAAGLAY